MLGQDLFFKMNAGRTPVRAGKDQQHRPVMFGRLLKSFVRVLLHLRPYGQARKAEAERQNKRQSEACQERVFVAVKVTILEGKMFLDKIIT
jgi:hypothetical protein